MPRGPENDFQKAVLDVLRIYGWTTAHFRPAMTKHGWRTPVSGDGKGFPDIVACGHGRTIFRELKAAKGRLRPEQTMWLELLERCGADVAVWTPDMWTEIVSDLGGAVAA